MWEIEKTKHDNLYYEHTIWPTFSIRIVTESPKHNYLVFIYCFTDHLVMIIWHWRSTVVFILKFKCPFSNNDTLVCHKWLKIKIMHTVSQFVGVVTNSLRGLAKCYPNQCLSIYVILTNFLGCYCNTIQITFNSILFS